VAGTTVEQFTMEALEMTGRADETRQRVIIFTGGNGFIIASEGFPAGPLPGRSEFDVTDGAG
jgi:hypothetical protein